MRDVIARQCEAMGMSEERIAQFFDPDHEPDPELCPYCGRPLGHHLLVPDDPKWGWSPIPEPCPDPECMAKAAAERDRESRRVQAVRLRQSIREAGIPRLYERCTTATFETRNDSLKNALHAVRRFVMDVETALKTGRGLYICGPVRAGKTHLAVIAARGVLCKDHYVRFASVPDLERRIRAAASCEDPLGEYRNCSLLVLDDFNAQVDQRWVLQRFCDLISARCANGRPTVYTSRCTIADLEKFLSRVDAATAQALTSLIAETTQTVKAIAPSYRAKKGGRP